MTERTPPRFGIGQQYVTRGRHKKLCTVRDVLRTYNHANELVDVRYVATHEFLGQVVTDYSVPETTVAMGAFDADALAEFKARHERKDR